MPLPEHEFRRRLRMVTGEFVNLLRNPDRIDSAPDEVRLYGLSFDVDQLWVASFCERHEISYAYAITGERSPSGDLTDVTENTISNILWSGAMLPAPPPAITGAAKKSA